MNKSKMKEEAMDIVNNIQLAEKDGTIQVVEYILAYEDIVKLVESYAVEYLVVDSCEPPPEYIPQSLKPQNS